MITQIINNTLDHPIPRTDSATGSRLCRSAAVSAAAHGPTDRQNDAAADVGDVVRQEQAATGVLV